VPKSLLDFIGANTKQVYVVVIRAVGTKNVSTFYATLLNFSMSSRSY